MRPILVTVGVVFALLFALLAVSARTDVPAAVVLGVLGTGAAWLALLGVSYPETGMPSLRTRPTAEGPARANPVREWLTSGELGHEEVVRLLDRIDRMGSHPNLPVRTEPEMSRYRSMAYGEFLEYVASRLDAIEEPA